MTIKELYNRDIKNQANRGWIQYITKLAQILDNSGYTDRKQMIDSYFTNKYSDLIVDDTLFVDLDKEDCYQQIVANVQACLYSHYEDIKRMFEIVSAEYNPIENYDRYEEYDKQTRTMTNAEVTTTDTNDKVTNTTTSKVAGYNSNTLTTSDSTESVSTGTGTNGKIVNESKTSQHIDTEVTSGTGTNGIINNHIHGNIGVTEATKMLENQEIFWSNFNFFDYLFKLVFRYLSIGVYECEV